MKYIVFALVLIANLVAVVIAVGPAFVTYAPVPPDSATCSMCNTPEVQQALTVTAQHWISGFVGQIRSNAAWLLAIAAVNVVVCAWLLFRGVSPNNSFKPKPLRGSA